MTRASAVLKNAKVSAVTAVGVAIAVLYFAQDVLIPLTMAVLFSFLLAPLCDRLERWRLGRILSVIVVVSVSAIFIFMLGWIVGRQVVGLAQDLPKYREEIIAKVKSLRGVAGERIEDFAQEIKEVTAAPATQSTQASGSGDGRETPERPADVGAQDQGVPPGHAPSKPIFTQAVEPSSSPFSALAGYLGLVLGPLGTAGLVMVFVFFMLLERDDLRDRALRLFSRGKYTVTTLALDDAASRISRYLIAQLIVNGSYGVAVTIGLWLIGVFTGTPFPSFVLWGLLCALLRFIPYIGPWVAAAFPIALSIIVYPGFTVFFVTTGAFVVIELISNNVMEPWLYGSSTGISTVAILVSAVFWTWLWGPVGLFLATPLTVCLVVLGKYSKKFEFFDVLLGDQPALEPSVSYYQRLLAGDREEAAKLVKEQMTEKGPEHVPDQVIAPALLMARRDRRDGDLTAETEQTVYESTGEIVRNVMHTDPIGEQKDLPLVIGCPAHHASEELITQMLDEVMTSVRIESLSTRLLPMEIEDRIAAGNPAVVFVAVVAPGGTTQARYLCRRLRRKFPALEIVVGYWGRVRDFDAMLLKLRSAGVRNVATSLLQSRSQIEAILQVGMGAKIK